MSESSESAKDPCRAKSTFSGPRFLAFALVFVAMLGGGGTLFIMLGQTSYGIQFASAVSYTAAIILYGFAKNRNGIVPYLFTCSVVVSQYPRLLKRHAGYLAVLIVLITTALWIKPHLSAWWFSASGPKGMSPFFIGAALPCGALALAEIFSVRKVLENAHVDRFGEVPEDNGP